MCASFPSGHKLLFSCVVLSYHCSHWKGRKGCETTGHLEQSLPLNVWFGWNYFPLPTWQWPPGTKARGNLRAMWEAESNQGLRKNHHWWSALTEVMHQFGAKHAPGDCWTWRQFQACSWFMEESEAETTLQSKKGWVLRNTAIFSIKFTGDVNGWIMMQPKGESYPAKRLSFAKRFPCQGIKTFHKKKKEVSTSYPASDRFRTVSFTQAPSSESEQKLQKYPGTKLAPMKAISHKQRKYRRKRRLLHLQSPWEREPRHMLMH